MHVSFTVINLKIKQLQFVKYLEKSRLEVAPQNVIITTFDSKGIQREAQTALILSGVALAVLVLVLIIVCRGRLSWRYIKQKLQPAKVSWLVRGRHSIVGPWVDTANYSMKKLRRTYFEISYSWMHQRVLNLQTSRVCSLDSRTRLSQWPKSSDRHGQPTAI